MKTYILSSKKCVFRLCFLLFIFCGNTLNAQFNNQLSIHGVGVDDGIYKLGSEWTFAYQFIPAPNKMSEYSINANDLNKVKNVVITVVRTPKYMKKVLETDSLPNFSFEYKYPPQVLSFQSVIIENEERVWIHPPRELFFKILQINPYPYIKKPLKKGLKWTWTLKIGDHWGDKRWKEWTV